MKLLLSLFLLAFVPTVFSQQVPDDSAVLVKLSQWKTEIGKVKPESLDVSYQGGKVIEQLRSICLSQLNETSTKLAATTPPLSIRSRALRHLALATQCVDELSLDLNNSDIAGKSSPHLDQFNASMNQVFSEMMKLRIQLENDLDDRIAAIETRAKK